MATMSFQNLRAALVLAILRFRALAPSSGYASTAAGLEVLAPFSRPGIASSSFCVYRW